MPKSNQLIRYFLKLNLVFLIFLVKRELLIAFYTNLTFITSII